jgi:hypothetical protein
MKLRGRTENFENPDQFWNLQLYRICYTSYTTKLQCVWILQLHRVCKILHTKTSEYRIYHLKHIPNYKNIRKITCSVNIKWQMLCFRDSIVYLWKHTQQLYSRCLKYHASSQRQAYTRFGVFRVTLRSVCRSVLGDGHLNTLFQFFQASMIIRTNALFEKSK